MSKVCCRRSGRRGFSLVEVVAGLVLLSTLLVSILVSFRAHATQIRSAQDRLAAIDTADRLLDEWMSGDGLPAVGNQERLPGDDGLSWRIVGSESPVIKPLGVQVVRLEVFRRAEGAPEQVLASVELIVQSGEASGNESRATREKL